MDLPISRDLVSEISAGIGICITREGFNPGNSKSGKP